jgi:hypothetical protein
LHFSEKSDKPVRTSAARIIWMQRQYEASKKRNYPVDITSAIQGFVRVIIFSINATVLYDEIEGIIHKPPIAAIALPIGVTLHKLLLR